MNNPPAFPCFDYIAQDGKENPKGMTLRDYFAAKAMPEIYQRVETGGFERVAKLCYEMADAMLKAREA
jgi:hypothetical protein